MRTSCKTWDCTRCAVALRQKLYKRALGGRPDRVLTLTVDPARHETKDAAAAALYLSWRLMRQALRESHNGGKVPFIAVFEQHVSGWPHLHILLRGTYISQEWASEYMQRRDGAPIVDIRRFRGRRQAAAYVSKYCAKAPHRYKGRKRYWSAPSWAPPRKPARTDVQRWVYAPRTLAQCALIEAAGGAVIRTISRDYALMEQPPP